MAGEVTKPQRQGGTEGKADDDLAHHRGLPEPARQVPTDLAPDEDQGER